jgi:hypothetical protein
MFWHAHRIDRRRGIMPLLAITGILVLLAFAGSALAGNGQAAPNPAPAAPTAACIEGWVHDALDIGLPGWVITAHPVGNPALSQTRTSDSLGYFRFDGLAAGDWVFTITVQPGWAPYPGTQTTLTVTLVDGMTCNGIRGLEDLRFKMQQGTPTPTPTWTPGPPATRLRGYVYQLTCNGMTPVRNARLDAWRSNTADTLDSIVQTRLTDAGGFYNFYLPTIPPPFYHIIVTPPAGLEPFQATSLEGIVVAPNHIRIDAPGYLVYEDNIFILRDPNLKCGTDTPTPTPTATPTATPTPPNGCIEGYKVDDLHVGLPGWEIHAVPDGSDEPHLVRITDGTGYFRFDDLTPGVWRLWEIMRPGWEPVTDEMFTVTVRGSLTCAQVRFKNRQLPPTPTPTNTPTPTPTPTETVPPPPNPLYFPRVFRPGGVCEIGRLQTIVWGHFYSFPIREDGLVRYVRPLPWQFPTVFRVVNYEGPTEWTQYKPFYVKQHGGYEFSYPGGRPGADFRLFLRTECGVIIIETSVDDPTPTPVPGTPTPTPTPPKLR